MKIKTSITDIREGHEYVRGESLNKLIKENTFTEAIFLLLKGQYPTKSQTKMLSAVLTAAIDHGPGTASAQTARIAASAQSDLHISVAAGILAMGKRHGSAIEPAARFFLENADCDDVESLAKELKENKVRVAGYGHPFLEEDSRTYCLFELADELGFAGKYTKFAKEFQLELNKQSSKKLPINIDGAMAAILLEMGFDAEIMKGFFLIARVPGLVAQVHEEITNDTGIRRMSQEDIEFIK